MYEIFPMIENRNGTNYISFFEDLPSSGFYDIYKNEEYIKTVAWNDNISESEMSFYDKEELSELLKDNNLNVLMMISPVEAHGRVSDDVVENIVNQSSLWKIFVIIALIALLIEILILRFWK